MDMRLLSKIDNKPRQNRRIHETHWQKLQIKSINENWSRYVCWILDDRLTKAIYCRWKQPGTIMKEYQEKGRLNELKTEQKVRE